MQLAMEALNEQNCACGCRLNGETRGGATEYLYGKVVGAPEARDRFRVHFTSMPPEMTGVLATLIQRHG